MKNKLRVAVYLASVSVIIALFSFSSVTKLSAVTTADVPDVVGLSQAKAVSEIFGAGLVLGNMTRASSGLVPLGDIIVQNPTMGTAVVPGTPVDLVISAGPARYSVPDVVGLTQAEAQGDIAAAELTVGRVALISNSNIPIGIVISQDPLAETGVTQKSAVNLIVSSGPP